jgi:hypothetical protein
LKKENSEITLIKKKLEEELKNAKTTASNLKDSEKKK